MPLLSDYLDNTTPRGAQQAAFEAALANDLFALFMEQRTGKTPVALGRIAYAHEVQKTCDSAIIVAMPSGVPQNWADEINGDADLGRPKRWPARIDTTTLVWRANKTATKGFQAALKDAIETKQFSFVLVNGEAILTDAFKEFAGKFLRKRQVFAVADETSLLIKTPSSKRTKVMSGIKKLTQQRLILDGTPAGESPLDLYSQVGWLDDKYLGHSSYFSFKNYYGEWEKGFDPRSGREFPKLKKNDDGTPMFRHLDELQRRLKACSFQVLRKDCFDMPDKIYQPYRFPLSPAQRQVYDDLEAEHEATLHDNSQVSVQHLLTRYLRFQQITSNFWPSDKTAALHAACNGEGCEGCNQEGVVYSSTPPRVIDPNRHPRMDAMIERIQLNSDPVIIWARFTADIEQIMKVCADLGCKPVRYDGKTSPDDKEISRRAFQSGRAGALVANQAAAQRGLDLSAAGWHLYYSNTFSGLQRQQTEDRTEVPGRFRGTGVEDLIAEDTVDENIVAAHLAKRSVAAFVMGQPNTRRTT